MKVLVIGSLGFIGSHCFKYFSSQYETWGADVVPGYGLPNYFRVDATDASFDNVFKNTRFDFCINCSGAANVQESLALPARDYYLNTFNVFKMLDVMRQHDSECKFINLSSAAVYGNPASLPVREDQACQPVSPYGFHKFQADLLCKEYYDLFSVSTCVVRIFSAYGPGLKKQIFWDLYQKSQVKSKISLFGTGRESRDFIYIDDLISAIEKVMFNANFDGSAINVGCGQEIYIEDAVSTFFGQLGWEGEYVFSDEVRAGDPTRWVADISTLSGLGYEPKVTLDNGLKQYIEWIKNTK